MCLAACAALAPSAATAQAVGPRITAALAAGDDATARALSREAGAAGTAHVEGLIALREGRPELAIAHFRTVLRLQPDNLAARRYLVRALAATGATTTAMFQLDELIARTDDPAQRARHMAERRALLARRPWGLSGTFALRPSSNVTGRTSNRTVAGFGGLGTGTIPERGESGLGLTLGLGTFRRWRTGERTQFRLDAFAGLNLHTVPELDGGYLGGAATLTRALAHGAADLRAEAVRGLNRDPQRDYTRLGLSVARRIPAGRSQWTLRAGAERTGYDDPAIARISDNTRLEIHVGGRWRATPRTTLGWRTGLAETFAADARFSHAELSGGVSAERRLASGWHVALAPGVELRRYDEVYGGPFPEPRRERILELEARVGNDRLAIRGAVPRITCRVQRTRSNITLYDDRDVTECSVILTRRF